MRPPSRPAARRNPSTGLRQQRTRRVPPAMAINSAKHVLPPGFDPSAHPFRLLGIDPGATASEIHSALGRARETHIAPRKGLAEASAAILDPARRLASELCYPLGSTPDRVDLFYAEGPVDASDDDI